MSENTLELAENKLLLLYIFKKIKIPISNNKITEIILENNFINYFILQQYLDELLVSKFIQYVDAEKDHKLLITKKGIKVLNLFENMISKEKIKIVDDYFKKHVNNTEKDVLISSEYISKDEDNYIVDLKVTKNEITLMNIKLSVKSDKEAHELCNKWKNNTDDIYYKIVQTLLEN
ncbi:DUF4364 family protein [Clostridium tyrobutyricum]|jgi:predicted transcriptional regulator|uniref:No significant homology n=1 Tax=Clostridium tyrobutyricum DIVETGP TaxID=1408889 RepID=W6NM37_CLOTY|nr:DUF4364 family protein [Clostridium tyrobutyricum]AND85769.1 hypothetical protein CTK_C25230 [Clostridium tyrobutyricum]ANP70287.1 hypothetical protein BA182_11550 [Clostridium tyrobutyricum]MBR9648305.1 DUF4364 family protein [Clostridium tyrobutyricum]MBV4417596.1 DUF4364 family protein [Clostridium tyrobutyricum]MBV4421230.1 DUF4364 family protein [Clostridium tyrobutyricum]